MLFFVYLRTVLDFMILYTFIGNDDQNCHINCSCVMMILFIHYNKSVSRRSCCEVFISLFLSWHEHSRVYMWPMWMKIMMFFPA